MPKLEINSGRNGVCFHESKGFHVWTGIATRNQQKHFFPNEIINRSLLNNTYVSEIYLEEARDRGIGKATNPDFSLSKVTFLGSLQDISRIPLGTPGGSGSPCTHDCSEWIQGPVYIAIFNRLQRDMFNQPNGIFIKLVTLIVLFNKVFWMRFKTDSKGYRIYAKK